LKDGPIHPPHCAGILPLPDLSMSCLKSLPGPKIGFRKRVPETGLPREGSILIIKTAKFFQKDPPA
jgi:hypothetical protein